MIIPEEFQKKIYLSNNAAYKYIFKWIDTNFLHVNKRIRNKANWFIKFFGKCQLRSWSKYMKQILYHSGKILVNIKKKKRLSILLSTSRLALLLGDFIYNAHILVIPRIRENVSKFCTLCWSYVLLKEKINRQNYGDSKKISSCKELRGRENE